jgi:hypothetical protein
MATKPKTNGPSTSSEIVELVVAIDRDSSDECLYVNNKAWPDKGETTVYATDIAEHAAGRLIRFEHRPVVAPDVWPDSLLDLPTA